MGNGFQFLDIILLVMVAAFIFLRLRNVLGRRMGHEQQPREEAEQDLRKSNIPFPEKENEGDIVVPINDTIDIAPVEPPATPLARTLREMQEIDGSVEPDRFASQAQMAYEAIVTAFANGDRAMLKDLLADNVFQSFDQAITTREDAGETMSTDLLSMISASIEDATLNGKEAEITVRFEAELISMTKDAEGVVVNGDPHPHTVREDWTFARKLRSRNPNWLLVATKGVE